MLSPDAVDLFSKAVLCWLATADAEGRPSVSPKEIFVVASPNELLLAEIASPRSARNVVANAAVCVSAVDVFEQHGYQVFGRAELVLPESPEFPSLLAPLVELAGPGFPVRGVIRVTVESVSRILAPSIWMHPDVPENERRRSALRAYGVRDDPDAGSEQVPTYPGRRDHE